MLQKQPVVTVIPGTPEQQARPATHECISTPPPGAIAGGGGGVTNPPPDPSLPAGEHIYLLHNGVYTESIAPPPAGYVCYLSDPFSYGGATVLSAIVCTG